MQRSQRYLINKSSSNRVKDNFVLNVIAMAKGVGIMSHHVHGHTHRKSNYLISPNVHYVDLNGDMEIIKYSVQNVYAIY